MSNVLINLKKEFNTSIYSDTNDYILSVYRYQSQYNPIYKKFITLLGLSAQEITAINEIPFLPISFFKQHLISCRSKNEPETVFHSSGTTGQQTSKHYIYDTSFYHNNALRIFEHFYGSLNQYSLLALLPSYLERKNSSLVNMCEYFMSKIQNTYQGFYLNNFEDLYSQLKINKSENKKTILIGVTYALMDFAEQFPLDFDDLIIMETGGMKGRRKEMLRSEIHHIIKNRIHVNAVHAEYGMTELLSQAYSDHEGIFKCAPGMKVLVRDMSDPLTVNKSGRGAINIIDLANLDTCCFIATDDQGEVFNDGSFTVNGRIDYSDTRGCSLMYN